MLCGVAVLLGVGVHDAVALITPSSLASQLALPLVSQLGRKISCNVTLTLEIC